MSKLGLLSILIAANEDQRKSIVEGHLLSLGYEVIVSKHYIYAEPDMFSRADILVTGFLDNPSHIERCEEAKVPNVSQSDKVIKLNEDSKGWSLHTGAQLYACLRMAEIDSSVSFLFIDDYYKEELMGGIDDFFEEEWIVPDYVVSFEADYEVKSGIVCETYQDKEQPPVFNNNKIEKWFPCECKVIEKESDVSDSSIAGLLSFESGTPAISLSLGVKGTYSPNETVNLELLEEVVESSIEFIINGVEDCFGLY